MWKNILKKTVLIVAEPVMLQMADSVTDVAALAKFRLSTEKKDKLKADTGNSRIVLQKRLND